MSLELASDQANAFVCVRLNELLASGESLQVTYGFLNLTHRNSHEHIEPLEPGSRYRVGLALNDIAHTFAAGSRVRIAISNAFWPWVWPSPRAARLSLFTAQSFMTLPARQARANDATLAALPPPKQSRVQAQTTLQAAAPMKAELHTDLTSGLQTFTYATDTGKARIENNGWCFSCKTENRYSIHPDDPNSAVIDLCTTETYGREGRLDVRTEARQVMTSDENSFHIEAKIETFENGESVFRRQWQQTIDRDGV